MGTGKLLVAVVVIAATLTSWSFGEPLVSKEEAVTAWLNRWDAAFAEQPAEREAFEQMAAIYVDVLWDPVTHAKGMGVPQTFALDTAVKCAVILRCPEPLLLSLSSTSEEARRFAAGGLLEVATKLEKEALPDFVSKLEKAIDLYPDNLVHVEEGKVYVRNGEEAQADGLVLQYIESAVERARRRMSLPSSR